MHHPSTPRPPMTTNVRLPMTCKKRGSMFQCWFTESSKSLLELTFFPQKCLSKDLLHFGENIVTERASIINYNLDRAGNNIKCSMLCLTKILLTLMRSICTLLQNLLISFPCSSTRFQNFKKMRRDLTCHLLLDFCIHQAYLSFF